MVSFILLFICIFLKREKEDKQTEMERQRNGNRGRDRSKEEWRWIGSEVWDISSGRKERRTIVIKIK